MAKWKVRWKEWHTGYVYGKDEDDVMQNAEITEPGEFEDVDYDSLEIIELVDREDEKPDPMYEAKKKMEE